MGKGRFKLLKCHLSKRSTFDFEPSEILSMEDWIVPEMEGVKLLRVDENREASKNQGLGFGIHRVQMGREGEGRSRWVRDRKSVV